MVTLWESSKILTLRRFPKKNFKEPTGPNAEKLGAQHVKMLGDAAKHLGAQSIFLGAPGYWVPVRFQQSCNA